MLFLAVEFAARPSSLACRPGAVGIPSIAFPAYFSPQSQDGDDSYIQVQFNEAFQYRPKKGE
jgi:hypothetical protein